MVSRRARLRAGPRSAWERPLVGASRHLDHLGELRRLHLDSLPRADLTQRWTDRGPRRDLSTLCLRPFCVLTPPFPRGWRRPQDEDLHRSSRPSFAALRPVALGRQAAGRSRRGSNGPRRRSPSATYGSPCVPRHLPPSRLAGPLSTAWVSSYTRSSSAITGSYRIVSASKPAIFFVHCPLRRRALAFAAPSASCSALALVVAGRIWHGNVSLMRQKMARRMSAGGGIIEYVSD